MTRDLSIIYLVLGVLGGMAGYFVLVSRLKARVNLALLAIPFVVLEMLRRVIHDLGYLNVGLFLLVLFDAAQPESKVQGVFSILAGNMLYCTGLNRYLETQVHVDLLSSIFLGLLVVVVILTLDVKSHGRDVGMKAESRKIMPVCSIVALILCMVLLNSFLSDPWTRIPLLLSVGGMLLLNHEVNQRIIARGERKQGRILNLGFLVGLESMILFLIYLFTRLMIISIFIPILMTVALISGQVALYEEAGIATSNNAS